MQGKKHGADYARRWLKVHLGIDAQTLEIRAIEVTDSSGGNVPMLPALLQQVGGAIASVSVSADGTYDTRDCHEAIAQRQVAAVIPTRGMRGCGRRG